METKQFLYLGYQRGRDDKLLHALEPIENGERAGHDREHVFGDTPKTSLRKFLIGHIYEIETQKAEGGQTTFILSHAKRVGALPDAAAAAAIRLASDAARVAIAADKRAEKEADDLKKLTDALAPIRDRYHRTISATERTAIELLVLRALRTYRS